jgi:hypothetical protein
VTVKPKYRTQNAIVWSVPVATAGASVCKFGLNIVVMAAFYCWQFWKNARSFPSPKTERINVSPPQQWQIFIVSFRLSKLNTGQYLAIANTHTWLHPIPCISSQFTINLLTQWTLYNIYGIYRVSQEERSIFRVVIVSVILSKKTLYEHVSYSEQFPRYSHLNVNRKIVDNKEILRVCTVPNTGIYCSSDRSWYSL